MYGFNKIILSRKGFDSAAGHGYSPFDSTTGKYIVLPIPEDEKGKHYRNSKKYEEIKIEPDYLPGISVSNLRDLIHSLNFSQKTKDVVSKNYVHFDPWLGMCPWLSGNNHNIGAFGQQGAAQTHLKNQGVGIGSLFLFFSRFIPINNRENRIVSAIAPNKLKKGVYFIYGWLKVERIIDKFEDIRSDNRYRHLLLDHPHASEECFKEKENKRNTIYIASEFLLNGCSIPGCGYFPKLSEELLLTSKNPNEEPPNTWDLPLFFRDQPPTYFPKDKQKWKPNPDGKTCTVRAPNRGQEFVFKESEDFCRWFQDLLRKIAS